MQLCSSLSILWHHLSLGLEWKLTFSSPVATAEFSKFAGILSSALSQHHLLGFRNSSTGISSLPLALFVVIFPRPTWLHIPGCLALGEWSYHRDYPGREDLFLYSSSENSLVNLRYHNIQFQQLIEMLPHCIVWSFCLFPLLNYFKTNPRPLDISPLILMYASHSFFLLHFIT